jgi:cysteinyl-tRNA synthetase
VRIHNTLTGEKEELVSLSPGEVRMYVCGVTPYDYSHIGHARSAVVFDVIRRYLLFKGWRVTMVRNYTDVDDKIIRRANQEGVPAREIAERYIAAEIEDMASLGVTAPDVAPKATDHVPAMVALIERLVASGFAYVVDGDVYFEIRRFPSYGRLSGKDLDDLLAGARVEVDERKRDPRDFALWKAAKPGEPSWPSPWGPGRPGWHIECSVMAIRYLGETFDIHGGGSDLIFPHHECEIAQAEAATGKTFSRYWIHNGMVNLGAEKMSKSLGNVLAIREILKRHDCDALRLWMLGTHYRNTLEWSEERVQESARGLQRLRNVIRFARERGTEAGMTAIERPSPSTVASGIGEILGTVKDEALRSEIDGFVSQFTAAMDDDFNTPRALAALFDLAGVANRQRDAVDQRPGEGAPGSASAAVEDAVRAGAVLGLLLGVLGLSARGTEAMPQSGAVLDLVTEREAARKRRDWRRADELRERLLHEHNVVVEDTAAGPRVIPRGP